MQRFDFDCVLTQEELLAMQQFRSGTRTNNAYLPYVAVGIGMAFGLFLCLSDFTRTELRRPIRYDLVATTTLSFLICYLFAIFKTFGRREHGAKTECKISYSFCSDFIQVSTPETVERVSWRLIQSLEFRDEYWRLLRGAEDASHDIVLLAKVVPSQLQTELLNSIRKWIDDRSEVSRKELVAGLVDEHPKFRAAVDLNREWIQKAAHEATLRTVNRQSEELEKSETPVPVSPIPFLIAVRPKASKPAKSGEQKTSSALFWLGIALVFGPMLMPEPYRERGMSVSAGVLIAVISYVIFLCTVLLMSRYSVRRQLSSKALEPIFEGTNTVEFATTGYLSLFDEAALSLMPWSSIQELKETATAIRVSQLDNRDFLIPKSSFRSPEEIDELMEFARVNLQRNLLQEGSVRRQVESGNPYQSPQA